MFPEVTYYVRYEYPNKKRLEFEKKRFFERYGLDFGDEESSKEYQEFRQNFVVSAIMIWCIVTQEGLCYQICCDLLSSLDGKIMGQKRRVESDGKGVIRPIDP